MPFAKCSKPGCENPAIYGCDVCPIGQPNKFCPDHGTKNRMTSSGEVTFCWRCGGYDADSEGEYQCR